MFIGCRLGAINLERKADESTAWEQNKPVELARFYITP
jgi:hypothetical protein